MEIEMSNAFFLEYILSYLTAAWTGARLAFLLGLISGLV